MEFSFFCLSRCFLFLLSSARAQVNKSIGVFKLGFMKGDNLVISYSNTVKKLLEKHGIKDEVKELRKALSTSTDGDSWVKTYKKVHSSAPMVTAGSRHTKNCTHPTPSLTRRSVISSSTILFRSSSLFTCCRLCTRPHRTTSFFCIALPTAPRQLRSKRQKAPCAIATAAHACTTHGFIMYVHADGYVRGISCVEL